MVLLRALPKFFASRSNTSAWARVLSAQLGGRTQCLAGFAFRRGCVHNASPPHFSAKLNVQSSSNKEPSGTTVTEMSTPGPAGTQKFASGPPVQIVEYDSLMCLDQDAMTKLRKAFVGESAYGVLAVRGVPGYAQARREAFDAAAQLAVKDDAARERIAAVRQTFPGWNGIPGRETHPLQSNFLHNIKEDVGNCAVDPYFGKNLWPSSEFKDKFVGMSSRMHNTAIQVLRGCDRLIEQEHGTAACEGRPSNVDVAQGGTALAGRWIMYDSAFSRDDLLWKDREAARLAEEQSEPAIEADASPHASSDVGRLTYVPAAMRTHNATMGPTHAQARAAHTVSQTQDNRGFEAVLSSGGSVGHNDDGLASMRTHATAIRTSGAAAVGHSEDGLASMRTHATAIRTSGSKSLGHSEDGLASMRTHATAIRSSGTPAVGHSEDGLASMRTHATAIRTSGAVGHSEDGLASMRTHATAIRTSGAAAVGHSEDGLASMRTHATAIRTSGAAAVGHSEDGLASMRTHATAIRTSGAAAVGHSEDGLASMRTHATAIRTSGAVGHSEDGLASMRTHATAIRTSGAAAVGHSEDGLASMRTHATAIRTSGATEVGHSEDGLASMRTHATAIRTSGAATETHTVNAKLEPPGEQESLVGDYWLPWHIDSQFVTLLTCDDYRDETTGARVAPPARRDGTGLIVMNKKGEVTAVAPQLNDDIMMVQMGGFAQIFSGGTLTACRHAVLRETAQPGIGRATYCNFWYAPWDLLCTVPPSRSIEQTVNSGWNAMMDHTYVDATMRQSFQAFRDFFTSVPVADEERRGALETSFERLFEKLPLPAPRPLALAATPRLVVDVLTDIRCPFSHVALRRLSQAIARMDAVDASRVELRYHPVFLNPEVPEEGEDLEPYLLREHGVTPEMASSPDYPLTVMGHEVGVTFSPKRRVVNTLQAFCALRVAAEEGREQALFEELSDRYFEDGVDINDAAVLQSAARKVGMATADDQFARRLEEARPQVIASYNNLFEEVASVPRVLFRDGNTGEGLDMTGVQTVERFDQALRQVLRPAESQQAGVRKLLHPPGEVVPGYGMAPVRLTHANPRSCVSMHMRARRGWFPTEWPYTDEDFRREDESEDAVMYEKPRLVTHLDADALASLTKAYGSLFGMARARLGRPLDLLDTCSSWISHFPQAALEGGARVCVQGLNEAELEANAQATERIVLDLNKQPRLPYEDDSFDFVTNVSSVDYLTRPREVFGEVHRVLRPGGVAVVAFSNRCFDSKAVAVWLRDISTGPALATTVANYLHFGAPEDQPWSHIASVDISPRTSSGEHIGDPMWLLLATK